MNDFFDDDEQDNKKSSEFAKMLEDSFKNTRKSVAAGDKIKAEILSIGKEEVFVSTGTMHDGIVPRKELLNPEGNFEHKVGDVLDLYVTHARGSEIYLSPKPTASNIADNLEDAFDMMLPIEGRVAEICKGGFRISIQGKMAFCPISQIDIKRVEVPEEYIGKKVEVLITQFSEGGRNIVVSRRKLLEEQKGVSDLAFFEEHRVGSVIRGKVTRIEKFGAFVEVAPALDGLVHVSELGWTRVNDPNDVVTVGQELMVKILKVEEKDGRTKLSLSVKQVGPEPWDNLSSQIREGQVVPGKVTRCMKFGAFVEIIPGVEGLIPLSEMSYTKRVMRSDELFKEGELITVMIKEIQTAEHRILLSLKDAGSDPWAMVPLKFPVGAIVKGQVERREPYGLFIQLDEGVVALLPKSKALEGADFPYEKLKPRDSVTVQIGELNLEGRRISLMVPQDPGRDDWKGFAQEKSGSFGTLADKLKNVMESKNKKKDSK